MLMICGPQAITILRTLIEQIVVRPGEPAPKIELVGAIATMVDLAVGAKTQKAARSGAALSELERRSVKVVAGARFEPARRPHYALSRQS